MTESADSTHITPVWLLLAVWAGLAVLTIATVGATKIDLGPANLWVALAIALVKAILVALFFMHLAHDRPFHAVVLGIALLVVVLFIGLALMDTMEYQANLIPGYGPALPR